ncbi:MAG: type II toxin-antitoxin system VapC family toxin [Allosphingosinicella sp.]
MAFVLDASLTLAWHFEDEGRDSVETLADRALIEGVVVPHHWFLEVSSGLVRGERRRRTSPELTFDFLARLASLPVEVDVIDPTKVTSVLIPLARKYRLSVYDAAYLELAGRRSLPLTTLDSSLAAAARAVEVELLAGE